MPSTIKCFSDDTKSSIKDKRAATTVSNPVVRSQFVPISEETATIILDVEEEREKLKSGGPSAGAEYGESSAETNVNPYDGLNIEREFIWHALNLFSAVKILFFF